MAVWQLNEFVEAIVRCAVYMYEEQPSKQIFPQVTCCCVCVGHCSVASYRSPVGPRLSSEGFGLGVLLAQYPVICLLVYCCCLTASLMVWASTSGASTSGASGCCGVGMGCCGVGMGWVLAGGLLVCWGTIIGFQVESFLANEVYDKCGRFEDDGIWVSAFAPLSEPILKCLKALWRVHTTTCPTDRHTK